jgi:PAS domain S-box-containing protein
MKDVGEQLIQDRIRDLRENTDFVAALFESLIGYAIIAADFDGNIIAYNEGAHQIYGYAPEEIIGRQSIEVFFPQDFIEAGALQRVRLSLEGEKVRVSGQVFPAQMLFTLTKDRSGRVVGFVEIVEDLTERKRAEEAEAQARASAERIEQLERELRSLEKLAAHPSAAVAAQPFGKAPLRESLPDTFNELVQRYGVLMDFALEQRAHEAEHDISGELGSISERLGFLIAGPRDVVEIHSNALKGKTNAVTPQRAQTYVEEGRLMVLELMGYLVAFYRTYAAGASRKSVDSNNQCR